MHDRLLVAEREWRWEEKLPEAEASRHSRHSAGRVGGAAGTMRGDGRGFSPQHPRPPALSSAGHTFLEILFASALLCILAGISVSSVTAVVDRSRGAGAVRYLATRAALARSRAVGRSATVALYFEQDSRGVRFSMVEDGNGDGVRMADITQQIDRVIEAPVHLSDLYPGAAIGLAPGTSGTSAVALGGTMILSFSPNGTATSGSVYVVGRDQTQWAVRVLGITARARVLRYERATATWVNAD
jgi:Tfp pilus assembly protein FimT